MSLQHQADLRREIDGLHAAMFELLHEFALLKRAKGMEEEEMQRRLVWYSALEQLAIEVGVYMRTGDDEALRTLWLSVGHLHKDVSPAVPRLMVARPA